MENGKWTMENKKNIPDPYEYSADTPVEELRFLEQRIIKILTINKEGTIFNRERKKKDIVRAECNAVENQVGI